MKNIVIIPARGGSKRLPKKNIRELCGKPLLAYSIEYAQSFRFVDEIIVSTDCEDIKRVALEYGAEVIIRPDILSGDLTPTIDVLQDALKRYKNLQDNDNIILLQPTNPLRPPYLLKEAYEFLIANNKDSLFTVSRDHNKLGKIVNGSYIPYNYSIGQRSQDMEPLYFENGLLYIAKKYKIEEGILIDKDSYPMIVEGNYGHVDIDYKEDFEYAEYLLGKKNF